MNVVNRFQILNKAAGNSPSAKTLEKGMNPTILPLSMGK